jgi:predicted DNA-binding transcriptional regulator AlpA
MSDRPASELLARPGALLTARELAAILSVSTSALLRWTRAGRVPAVKLPSGAVRYVPERIDAWLAARAMGTAGAEELSTTRAEPCPDGAYVPLRSLPSTTRPLDAAANEEDHDGRT